MNREEIIEKFYSAFAELDAETMANLYHDKVIFSDPAFGELQGEHAKNMWKMLAGSQKGKDFKIVFSDIRTEGDEVCAHWEAFYTFSQTGRKVHNIIDARFQFEGDKIKIHHDRFDLHRWASQALGWKGALFGGMGFFKRALQKQTGKALDHFELRIKS